MLLIVLDDRVEVVSVEVVTVENVLEVLERVVLD